MVLLHRSESNFSPSIGVSSSETRLFLSVSIVIPKSLLAHEI